MPTLNEYSSAQRSNKYYGASFKRNIENEIEWYIISALNKGYIKKWDNKPCVILIDFYEKTKRRDVDNIQSSQKFILDALVNCEIIKDDGQKYVKNIFHRVFNAKKDYAEVHILELNEINLELIQKA